MAEAAPKKVHAFFLEGRPGPEAVAALSEFDCAPDSWTLSEGHEAPYLQAPQGFGRSKTPERLDRTLKVAATVRNLGSVSKTGELARG